MKEHRRRSLAKTVTYRIMAAVILGIITWVYTREFFTTSAITITFTIVATIAFYINERLWNKTEWGREKQR